MKKQVNTKVRNWAYTIFNIVVGNFMMGFAYSIFVLPNDVVSGGTGGIGVVIRGLFNFDPKLLVTIFMWVVFILGWIIFGKKFALKTLPSTFLYPISIYVFGAIKPLQEMALNLNNPLLAAIFAGALYGIASAMIFKVGGSSGGTDIPALIIAKYTNLSFEKIIFLQDALIIVVGIFAVGFENSLIGIVLCFISMEAIDRLMFGGSETMMLFIISDKLEDINKHILTKFERGTTILPAFGGYTGQEKKMIQTVISRNEYVELSAFISKCDPKAFVTILNAKETIGEGFKTNKNI